MAMPERRYHRPVALVVGSILLTDSIETLYIDEHVIQLDRPRRENQ